jgi:branched-chain amino acid transport system ATP-binding protein
VDSVLKASSLEVYYGSIHAIQGISFEVARGEIVSLIGSNGSGKTSTLHAISGIVPKKGKVEYDGTDISQMRPDRIVGQGLVQVPEGRRIFANLSVQENLDMGAYTEKDRARKALNEERVFQSFPRLKERRFQVAGTLSGGEQQMLAIGRALMANPRLLLLDEPSMGLAPVLVDEIFSIIKRINESGVTVLLVEQNAFMALSISSRAYVLETGRIAVSGTSEELMADERIKKAYLGG